MPTNVSAANDRTILLWEQENETSSSSRLQTGELTDLPPDAQEMHGRLVQITGQTKLGGRFFHAPYQKKSAVTSDAFDQVVLYHALTSAQHALMALGFDIPGIIATRHQGARHVVRANVNTVPDLNAWYMPSKDDLTFGRGNDKWHLGQDADVAVHELGHLVLDHIHPGLTGRFAGPEAGAIHEGFGDIFAGLLHNDPELSEDFPVARDQAPDVTKGLRDMKNQKTLAEVGQEPHERSLPYAGFFWSLRDKLAAADGTFRLDGRPASNLALTLLYAHAFHYTTSKPKSVDFVDAVLTGVSSLDKEGQLAGLPVGALRETILQEGVKRKLLTDAEAAARRTPEPAPAPTPVNLRQVEVAFGKQVLFTAWHTISYSGGRSEILQQEYRTATHGTVAMRGNMLHVKYDPTGRTVLLVSTRDARTVRPGEIDETVQLSATAALAVAFKHARRREEETGARLRAAQQQSGNDPVVTAAPAMQARLAASAAEGLRQRMTDPAHHPEPPLVLPADSTTLAYEITLDYETYYVDAKTGAITTDQTVIIN